MDNNNKNGAMQNYVIVAIIAFALGLGSGALWAEKKASLTASPADSTENTAVVVGSDVSTPSSTTSNPSDETTAEQPTGTLLVKNSVIVHDQVPGVSVEVSALSIEQSSWIVIREDNGAGAPGKILGAQLFDAGTGSGKVDLLRGTEEGKTYYAMIYTDNGDRSFDPKTDTPILRDDGTPVSMAFKATASATSVGPNNL
jgi:hypothetical protein